WSASGDLVWKGWGSVSSMLSGSRARAARRGGGFWTNGSQTGRFALSLDNIPMNVGSNIGGRCALSAPSPGHVRFRSHSEAAHARFAWKIWGNNAATTVRIAFAKTRADLDNWDGSASGSSISDDLYTASSFDR